MSFRKTYAQALATHKPLSRKSSLRRTRIKSQPVSLSEGEKVSQKGEGLKRSPLKATSARPSLKDRVWKQFSVFIRRRDSVAGWVCCVTCWIEIPWKEAHAGHFVPGRNNSILFDERNCHPQCQSCNITLGGNPSAYEDFMVKRYGEKVVDELRALRDETKKWGAEELKDLLYRYKSLSSE